MMEIVDKQNTVIKIVGDRIYENYHGEDCIRVIEAVENMLLMTHALEKIAGRRLQTYEISDLLKKTEPPELFSRDVQQAQEVVAEAVKVIKESSKTQAEEILAATLLKQPALLVEVTSEGNAFA